jgi:Male sterility protein
MTQARRVGAIVHAAADIQLNATLDDLTATNLVCTSNVLVFAEHADVPVHYVQHRLHPLSAALGKRRPIAAICGV